MRGDRLRKLRLELGYTQEELADKLDMGVRQVWRYENDENAPSSETLARISHLLGVSADYLLGLSDTPAPENQSGTLSTNERAALAAWRYGDKLEAIRIIVST